MTEVSLICCWIKSTSSEECFSRNASELVVPGGGHSHYYANGDVPQVWVSFQGKILLLGMKFV